MLSHVRFVSKFLVENVWLRFHTFFADYIFGARSVPLLLWKQKTCHKCQRLKCVTDFLRTNSKVCKSCNPVQKNRKVSVENRIWRNQIARARKELRKIGHRSIPKCPMKLLGCNRVSLATHLKYRASVTGLIWDEYGSTWHVDHIIPVAAWNLKEPRNFPKAFGIGNLQPLSAAENLSKGCSIPTNK